MLHDDLLHTNLGSSSHLVAQALPSTSRHQHKQVPSSPGLLHHGLLPWPKPRMFQNLEVDQVNQVQRLFIFTERGPPRGQCHAWLLPLLLEAPLLQLLLINAAGSSSSGGQQQQQHRQCLAAAEAAVP